MIRALLLNDEKAKKEREDETAPNKSLEAVFCFIKRIDVDTYRTSRWFLYDLTINKKIGLKKHLACVALFFSVLFAQVQKNPSKSRRFKPSTLEGKRLN